jgi:hypothetical protein
MGKPTAKELTEIARIAAGAPGKTVGSAQTSSDFTVDFGGGTGGRINPDPVLTADPDNPKAFVLADNIVVTVTFNANGSWKLLAPLTLTGEQFLLDHEQGHYNISALMGRDCFIKLMQLKANSYGSRADGEQAARNVIAFYHDRLQPAQDTYDSDTTHGAWFVPSSMGLERKGSDQTKWEGFLTRARTERRVPEIRSPADNEPYKVRLLDVLATAGFTIQPPTP